MVTKKSSVSKGVSKSVVNDDIFEFMQKMNSFAFIPSESNMYDIKTWSDTGVNILNLVLSDADIYKGLVNGKRYVIAGENSTAKSLVTLQILARFLDADPSNKVIYFESESAILTEHLNEVGVDKDRILITPVWFVEDFRHQALNALDKIIAKKENKDNKDKHLGNYLLCMDSLGMLSSKDEEEKSLSDSDKKSMSKPQLIASVYRQIAMRCARAQSPFITVQHVHNKTGGQNIGNAFFKPDKEIQGGEVLRFCGDVILYMSKVNEYESGESGEVDESTKKAKVGIKAIMKIKKSRFMRDNITFPLTILYGVGILKYSGLFDEGVKADIFKSRSNFYENTITGNRFFKKDLVKNADAIYDKPTLDALREYIRNKYSLFGGLKPEEVDEFVGDETEPSENNQ